ncbi:unnamed protein product, partial [Iphiclides podalirius]
MCSCPSGYDGDPAVKCSPKQFGCSRNEDCSLTEACINNACQHPCAIHNPCAPNAVCINTNHGSDCGCIEGFQGNGYVGCVPVRNPSESVCQYNEDCPPELLCDRMNRVCINPCAINKCGDNAECVPENHGVQCKCGAGFTGNPFLECYKVQGCRSDNECLNSEACINGNCGSPCCEPPTNPCTPNPCGINALCESDNGNPICFCPKGLTGNPFKTCIPEGNECEPNPCGPNTGCRLIEVSCACPEGYIGDPNIQCIYRPVLVTPENTTIQACTPNPCDSNAICDSYGGQMAICISCVGPPHLNNPSCRAECILSSDCEFSKACLRNKCVDPCPGSCGVNADCLVYHHDPICRCREGFEGNPYEHCKPTASVHESCDNIRCGDNAMCQNTNDCPNNLACLSNYCRDPCKDLCGVNTECTVTNHVPVCTCFKGYEGDPFSSCRQITKSPTPINPCEPSPCGPNSECHVVGERAACSCRAGFLGAPPSCRPECAVSSDCPINRACINHKCQDPCIHSCGLDARCYVVGHNPICSCPDNLPEGDPFIRCFRKNITFVTPDPCLNSPCGPYSTCRNEAGRAICACEAGTLGAPPSCRPQCVINQDCPLALACSSDTSCFNNKCVDPCPGTCGQNAVCRVSNHAPSCSCLPGYSGNPLHACTPIMTPSETIDPCHPTPCGPYSSCGNHAFCNVVKHVPICTCEQGYTGDPFAGCSEVLSIESQEVSPCSKYPCGANAICKERYGAGVCGMNAECRVNNHAPSCACLPGYEGNPFTSCYLRVEKPVDPCSPSPCGPHSICRINNGYAICSCQEDYFGSPPLCRPECMVSSDCMPNKACVNQKCVDPCNGACGNNAKCMVVNHKALCSCPQNYIGDPFVQCSYDKRPETKPSGNPCIPSPCGPNSQCRIVGETPACSCLTGFIGRAPNCRPECIYDDECPSNLACIREKCMSPCEGSCGSNAECVVISHKAVCHCRESYTGDPFNGCYFIVTVTSDDETNPCNPSPCGPNAICKEKNSAGSCTCLPGYFGDPYLGCRPECVTNNDCPLNKACSNNKCVDPCQEACGINAHCKVAHHTPVCLCIDGFEGNPVVSCHPQRSPTLADENPCTPSPCGPYSLCKVIDNHGVCSCQQGYVGSPPTCRPECVISTDCPQHQACMQQKCKDPCPGTCGVNARCQVINHNPICTCKAGFTGDPFVTCQLEKKPIFTGPKGNPCVPSPCGPYSQCKVVGEAPACSCLPNYVGIAPNCRPECSINAECPGNLACQNEKCVDPCPGSCGFNAECSVANHVALCNCISGHTGDPFSGCSIIERTSEPPPNPCNPSPCGANAICKERNGIGACSCLPEYFGDPYTGCRPECVSNSDCDRNKACTNNSCITGYTGDPFTECIEEPRQINHVNPCVPSPCGPNSECRVISDQAACSCLPNYIGRVPNCRPECTIDAECPSNAACINERCKDPCQGACGLNAMCLTVNHKPICSCQHGYTGDAIGTCVQMIIPTTERSSPCTPSPCGPNAECREHNEAGACFCSEGYEGDPYSPSGCRREHDRRSVYSLLQYSTYY